MAESSAQGKILDEVCEAFGLDGRPERIEVYDNAHIQGTNAVGGMIVAGPEGFQKNQYRKFNIRGEDLTPGDDYGMMREVMRRRFARLVKEEEAGEDAVRARPAADRRRRRPAGRGAGGAGRSGPGRHPRRRRGQGAGPRRRAGAVLHARASRPSCCRRRSPALYYLQRLRDEAHRFAIGAHRTRRSMDIKKNPLDEIEGVGPGRKKALLHAFGSAKGVSRASVADLVKVEGVNQPMAERIHAFFHTAQR